VDRVAASLPRGRAGQTSAAPGGGTLALRCKPLLPACAAASRPRLGRRSRELAPCPYLRSSVTLRGCEQATAMLWPRGCRAVAPSSRRRNKSLVAWLKRRRGVCVRVRACDGVGVGREATARGVTAGGAWLSV